MPASIYAWLPEEREDEERKQLLEGLYQELDECTEVKITTRNRLKIFLPERGIWHIWDIDYAVRQEYEKSLHGTIAPNCYPTYMNEFDWIKRHSVLERLQTLAGEKAEKTDLDKNKEIDGAILIFKQVSKKAATLKHFRMSVSL